MGEPSTNPSASAISAAYDQTVDVGVSLGWTIFNGFKLQTNYKRLQELKTLGLLKTRLEVEDFVANLTAEYYNLIQQTLRLKNYRYAVALSRGGRIFQALSASGGRTLNFSLRNTRQ